MLLSVVLLVVSFCWCTLCCGYLIVVAVNRRAGCGCIVGRLAVGTMPVSLMLRMRMQLLPPVLRFVMLLVGLLVLCILSMLMLSLVCAFVVFLLLVCCILTPCAIRAYATDIIDGVSGSVCIVDAFALVLSVVYRRCSNTTRIYTGGVI